MEVVEADHIMSVHHQLLVIQAEVAGVGQIMQPQVEQQPQLVKEITAVKVDLELVILVTEVVGAEPAVLVLLVLAEEPGVLESLMEY